MRSNVMKKARTYYDILGVSRDATLEEISAAKNALAKIYHPDANVHKDIDTTELMQDILEAYRTLSDPEKRSAYNIEVFGTNEQRVFRTFTIGPESENEDEASSFVTYWNTANRLHEILRKGVRLMDNKPKKKELSRRIFRRIAKTETREEAERSRQIAELSAQAVQLITVLKLAGIPMQYWSPDAMNWMLVRWGQKQNMDYHLLFARYDTYVEETKSGSEKMRLRSQTRRFHHNLKRLLSHTLEA